MNSPKTQKNRVSLKTIADRANVTRMTVSKVLNGTGCISAETRKRVLDIASELKYRPNMLARGMQTGTSNLIGVIMPVQGNYQKIIEGIHGSLTQNKQSLLLTWPSQDSLSDSSKEEIEQIDRLVAMRVDGIITRITHESVDEHYFKEVIEREIPIVAVDRGLTRYKISFVGSDNEAIGREAAERLLSFGHTHFAVISSQKTESSEQLMRTGFTKTIQARNLNHSIHHLYSKDFSSDTLLAEELFKRSPRPTAVFTTNDALAEAVYKAAHSANIKIPEQLSVIACGNLCTRFRFEPSLSTFDQNQQAIGLEAAKLLLQMVQSSESTSLIKTILVPAQFLPGGSIAPPPS